MLYRVTIGRDDYLGTADEVLAFMRRAQGAPGSDVFSFMEGVAARLRDQLGVTGLPTSSPEGSLLALAERRLVRVEQVSEPNTEPIDPRIALGDGPVVYGEGVDPDDIP